MLLFSVEQDIKPVSGPVYRHPINFNDAVISPLHADTRQRISVVTIKLDTVIGHDFDCDFRNAGVGDLRYAGGRNGTFRRF